MLNGLIPPYTPSGRSALVESPPWHYAGQALSLSFSVNRETAQALLPPGCGFATGRAAAHFCEWQATTDGSELLDPIYAQYKEFIVLIELDRGGEHWFFCPFIYVDQDISLARGWLQGWPKKMGSVWMTRSYDLVHPAAAQIKPGQAFGASLAVKDRRLAEATIRLTGDLSPPLGFFSAPTVGLVAPPSIIGGAQKGEMKLVRAQIGQKITGPAYAATGELRLFGSPRDELALLQPTEMGPASLSTFALTVEGAIEVAPLRAEG
ncbi:MAG: acetoacetate decarboxylase family protein [Elstera sp.]